MSKQYLTTNDGIRPAARTPSNASADTSDDLFRGSHICGKTGRRQVYLNAVLHAWDGRAWRAVDSVRVADSGGRVIDAEAIARMPAGQARVDAYKQALADANAAALAETGVSDPTEAAIAQSMANVGQVNAEIAAGTNKQRDEYLRMVKEANERALKMTGVEK